MLKLIYNQSLQFFIPLFHRRDDSLNTMFKTLHATWYDFGLAILNIAKDRFACALKSNVLLL